RRPRRAHARRAGAPRSRSRSATTRDRGGTAGERRPSRPVPLVVSGEPRRRAWRAGMKAVAQVLSFRRRRTRRDEVLDRLSTPAEWTAELELLDTVAVACEGRLSARAIDSVITDFRLRLDEHSDFRRRLSLLAAVQADADRGGLIIVPSVREDLCNGRVLLTE